MIYVIDIEGATRFKNIRGKELDAAVAKLLAEASHEVEFIHDHDDKSANDK